MEAVELNFEPFIFERGNIKTKAVLDVESKRGYWLTVYAQDHGVVPLSSSLQ
ncbi:hypothetical protein K0M31_012894, partial [Melipona bicolor]